VARWTCTIKEILVSFGERGGLIPRPGTALQQDGCFSRLSVFGQLPHVECVQLAAAFGSQSSLPIEKQSGSKLHALHIQANPLSNSGNEPLVGAHHVASLQQKKDSKMHFGLTEQQGIPHPNSV
jgi:hypothetical protein